MLYLVFAFILNRRGKSGKALVMVSAVDKEAACRQTSELSKTEDAEKGSYQQ